MVAESYWSSTPVATKTGEVQKALTYISMGIFAFDLVLNAPFDWSILSGQRARKWPQILYFGTKLIFALFVALDTVLFWLPSEINCGAALIAVEWSMGATVIMSSSLLACRTVCVFFGTARKVVTAAVLVFGAGLAAAWMHGVQDVPAAWSTAAASPWNTGACAPTGIKETYFVKYVVTILFDLFVLAVTTVGILRMNASSRIGDVLIKQGVIYFVLTFAVNLVITVLTILKLSPAMSLIAACPQSLICVVASTRLYRELIEEASPKNVSSTGAGGSHGSGSRNGTLASKSLRGAAASTSSQTGMSTSSVDKMEKGGIVVQQTHAIQTSPMPEYLRGHPFNNLSTVSYDQQHSTDSSPTSQRDDPVAASYPRLLGRTSPQGRPL